MHRNLSVNVDELIDLLECIQDSNENIDVIQTIDEVITVVYDLVKEDMEFKECKFSIVLKKLMKEQGYSVKRLSEHTDIPTSTLDSWLYYDVKPSADYLMLISDVLNVSIDYLCFGDTKG